MWTTTSNQFRTLIYFFIKYNFQKGRGLGTFCVMSELRNFFLLRIFYIYWNKRNVERLWIYYYWLYDNWIGWNHPLRHIPQVIIIDSIPNQPNLCRTNKSETCLFWIVLYCFHYLCPNLYLLYQIELIRWQ